MNTLFLALNNRTLNIVWPFTKKLQSLVKYFGKLNWFNLYSEKVDLTEFSDGMKVNLCKCLICMTTINSLRQELFKNKCVFLDLSFHDHNWIRMKFLVLSFTIIWEFLVLCEGILTYDFGATNITIFILHVNTFFP